jgi:hypothetical protein
MASELTPLRSRRKQLLDRDPAVSLPKSADIRDSFIDFFLSPINLGHYPSDGAAVAGDNKRFPSLHVIEQSRQVGFGFGSLDFTHADS